MLSKQQAIDQMNEWGGQSKPFLFVTDFEGSQTLLYPLEHIPDFIHYSINGKGNDSKDKVCNEEFLFDANPVSFEEYSVAFEQVMKQLNYGNSYLLNLTFQTQLETDLDLLSIFKRSNAPYKLLVKPNFVVFSPETFIRIENNIISSYPMKGTIDASTQNAKEVLLNDPKEEAEHATIVDLIRNDLSIVATNVRVANYRYVDKVKTNKRTLLQVSSEIEGTLPKSHLTRLGSTVFSLLPAGSISGAPKRKTVEIIKRIESYKRKFFTGVFGVFDGHTLDSGVMIRFIEMKNNKMIFKSGGGVTAQSDAKSEYRELINKVYVPFI